MSSKRTTATAAASAVPVPPLPSDSTVLDHVKALDLQKFVSETAGLQAVLNSTLSGISEQVLSRSGTVQELTRAIELKKEELEGLFGKERVLKQIADLETEIVEARAAFEREKIEEQRRRAAAEATWQFTFDQRKSSSENSLADARLAQARKDEQEKYEREQAWARRDAALVASEKELADLRQLAASFDAKVTAEVNRQVGIKEGFIKRDFEHKQALLEADYKGKIALLNANIEALSGQVRDKDSEVRRLQTALEAAHTREAQTTANALAAAGGKQALEQVQATIASTSTAKK